MQEKLKRLKEFYVDSREIDDKGHSIHKFHSWLMDALLKSPIASTEADNSELSDYHDEVASALYGITAAVEAVVKASELAEKPGANPDEISASVMSAEIEVRNARKLAGIAKNKKNTISKKDDDIYENLGIIVDALTKNADELSAVSKDLSTRHPPLSSDEFEQRIGVLTEKSEKLQKLHIASQTKVLEYLRAYESLPTEEAENLLKVARSEYSQIIEEIVKVKEDIERLQIQQKQAVQLAKEPKEPDKLGSSQEEGHIQKVAEMLQKSIKEFAATCIVKDYDNAQVKKAAAAFVRVTLKMLKDDGVITPDEHGVLSKNAQHLATQLREEVNRAQQPLYDLNLKDRMCLEVGTWLREHASGPESMLFKLGSSLLANVEKHTTKAIDAASIEIGAKVTSWAGKAKEREVTQTETQRS